MIKYAVFALALFGGQAMADDGHPISYNFQAKADGNNPRGSLLVDTQGNLYGTAPFAGAYNNGTVYVFVPSENGPGTLTTLYSFTGGADGSVPSAGLIADSQGNLFGKTALDGAGLTGTVFELLPPAAGQTTWTETTLWSFGAGADGKNPVGNLILGADGSLYGTTNWGGFYGHGTVFQLLRSDAGWTENIVWSFSGQGDGAQPVAGLTLDQKGNLYGTTTLGGSSGEGTVFQITPSQAGTPATLSTIWNFTGGPDGSEPSSTLAMGFDGSLYGTTTFGGSPDSTCWQNSFPFYGEPLSDSRYAKAAPYVPTGGDECGTVFRLTPTSATPPWSLTTLYAFQGTPDGGNPLAGPALLPNGNLLGYTVNLGKKFFGAAYELTPATNPGRSWKLNTPASFNAAPEGLYALGTPVLGLGGRAYGTMELGGKTWVHVTYFGYGVIFSVMP